MAKHMKRELLTIDGWRTLQDDKTIRDRIKCDSYSKVYPTLLAHFAGIRTPDWDAAVVGLHIVYGWMPTIPKLSNIMTWQEDKQQQLVVALANARSGQLPTDSEWETLKAFCNNSVIGASKLLHFLKPDTFPIWDTNVARAFWKKNPKATWQQANDIARWKDYQRELSKWLTDPSVKAKCKELRKLASFLHDVSDLRMIELVMFHEYASKKKR